MNCREFENLWNERLDGAPELAPATRREMDRHEGACARCREISTRFETLERTIDLWKDREIIEASAEWSSRVIDRFHQEKTARKSKVSTILFRQSSPRRRLATAATLVLAFAAAVASRKEPARIDDGAGERGFQAENVDRSAERSSAFEAVSQASDAAWRWASVTSGPAARTGLRVWDSARPNLDLGALDFDFSRPIEPNTNRDPARGRRRSSTVPRFGDRLNSRIQPFSSSARRAFGFLTPSTSTKPIDRAPASSLDLD